MEKLVKKVIKLDLEDIKTYEFPLDELFGLEIIHEGIKFCLIINFSSNNKNLICCGPGAFARNSRTSQGVLIEPPFFNRWSWFKYFDESFITYADPVFFYDDEITIGWFVGDKNQWYLNTVAEIIEKLASNQKIFNENILFYGSSGGGFVSIGLGTLIKDSKVLVNNSQFTILNYYNTHINNLFRVLQKDFPDLSQEEIADIVDYRINTIDLFKKENYIPPITYYVNTASAPDLERHCIPFINDIKELDIFKDQLEIHFYKEVKDKPHGPLPNEVSIELIKTFAKDNLYNGNEDNSFFKRFK